MIGRAIGPTEEQLPASEALDLYRIRWQIELLFKSLKSECGLKNIKKYSTKKAVEGFVLAKLIYCVVALGAFKAQASKATFETSLSSWYKGFRAIRFKVTEGLLNKTLEEVAQDLAKIYQERSQRSRGSYKLSLEQVWDNFAPGTDSGTGF